MSIIHALRSYLAQCPALGSGAVMTGWTGRAGDWGLFPAGQTETARCFDGSRSIRCRCLLSVRRFTQADGERTGNEALLEEIALWIARQDQAGSYPDLGEGLQAQSLGCEGGALDSYDETGSEGRYSLTLILDYERAD